MAEATDEEDAKELVDFTLKKFGRIDILVLAAGVAAHTSFKDMPDLKMFRKIVDACPAQQRLEDRCSRIWTRNLCIGIISTYIYRFNFSVLR